MRNPSCTPDLYESGIYKARKKKKRKKCSNKRRFLRSFAFFSRARSHPFPISASRRFGPESFDPDRLVASLSSPATDRSAFVPGVDRSVRWIPPEEWSPRRRGERRRRWRLISRRWRRRRRLPRRGGFRGGYGGGSWRAPAGAPSRPAWRRSKPSSEKPILGDRYPSDGQSCQRGRILDVLCTKFY